jgi:hypothetical protein
LFVSTRIVLCSVVICEWHMSLSSFYSTKSSHTLLPLTKQWVHWEVVSSSLSSDSTQRFVGWLVDRILTFVSFAVFPRLHFMSVCGAPSMASTKPLRLSFHQA